MYNTQSHLCLGLSMLDVIFFFFANFEDPIKPSSQYLNNVQLLRILSEAAHIRGFNTSGPQLCINSQAGNSRELGKSKYLRKI